MTGHAEPGRPTWRVTLRDDVARDVNRVEYARAHVRLDEQNGPVAHVTGAQGSGRLLSLAEANALLRLDQSTPVVTAGTVVPALILGPVDGT